MCACRRAKKKKIKRGKDWKKEIKVPKRDERSDRFR